jgi:hypothetical protein
LMPLSWWFSSILGEKFVKRYLNEIAFPILLKKFDAIVT